MKFTMQLFIVNSAFGGTFHGVKEGRANAAIQEENQLIEKLLWHFEVNFTISYLRTLESWVSDDDMIVENHKTLFLAAMQQAKGFLHVQMEAKLKVFSNHNNETSTGKTHHAFLRRRPVFKISFHNGSNESPTSS